MPSIPTCSASPNSAPRAWRDARACLGACLCAGLLLSTPAAGKQDLLDYGYYPEGIEEAPDWEEQEAPLPAYPDVRSLVELPVPQAGPGYTFGIVLDALGVGDDEVVRYTVVIRSAGGARNVLFEGLRCGANEFKTYAYGRPDGSFRPVRAPRWQRITDRGVMAFRGELAHGYFCAGFGPQSERVIRRRLEYASATDSTQGQDFTY